MPTRRNFIRTAVALPALAAVPAVATVCAADPSIVAINAYREARSAYDALFQVPGDRFDEDPEIDAALKALCVAELRALRTVPTTAAGLRAFCEFAAQANAEAELCSWTPGVPLGIVDLPDGAEMFITTLATAARRLLPA